MLYWSLKSYSKGLNIGLKTPKKNPTEKRFFRLAQISDFHFFHWSLNPLSLFSKRILATLNFLLWRRKEFFEKPLWALPELLSSLDVDLVLLGGDFTTSSHKKEMKKALKWVQKLAVPYRAIPGNHDNYTLFSAWQKRFFSYFSHPEEEYPFCFYSLRDHRIEVKNLKENWWLISLDSTKATHPLSSGGVFFPSLERYLQDILKRLDSHASIILFHHFPLFQNDEKRRALKRAKRLEAIVRKDPRIRLYLNGHTHRRCVADLQPSGYPIVLDSGSVSMGSWNLIDLSNTHCLVTEYLWNDGWKKGKVHTFSLEKSP